MSALVVPSFFYRKFLTIAALFKNNKRWRQPDEWIRVHAFFSCNFGGWGKADSCGHAARRGQQL